jgi:hypothetical protein|tara:strand:- start:134 stop:490 length:357 start_codon:yes stop_codon:yes gene_type:complete
MNILHNFLIPEAAHREKFWANQPIDDPNTINGFNGTFAFSKHSRIPQGIVEFLLEHFHKQCSSSKTANSKKNHIEAIELDEINELMNRIWDGPGSMNKLATLTNEMRIARLWNNEDEE